MCLGQVEDILTGFPTSHRSCAYSDFRVQARCVPRCINHTNRKNSSFSEFGILGSYSLESEILNTFTSKFQWYIGIGRCALYYIHTGIHTGRRLRAGREARCDGQRHWALISHSRSHYSHLTRNTTTFRVVWCLVPGRKLLHPLPHYLYNTPCCCKTPSTRETPSIQQYRMGLFSVLTESTTTSASAEDSPPGVASAKTSSGDIPTVVQLYTGNSPIKMDETSKITGYSEVTYQAVQIGSSLEEEIKNRHQNPDLGVWNCRVTPGVENQALADALLAKVATNVPAYCMSLDLSEASQVEPAVTLLQNALIRHLIDMPVPSEAAPVRVTATTSLSKLQTTEFGKANEDTSDTSGRTANNNENSNSTGNDITTTLLICAQIPPEEDAHSDDTEAYKRKQALSLVIYHLRKFAAALNCALCFVHPPTTQSTLPNADATDTKSVATVTASSALLSSSLQPSTDYETLAQWCRDLALDKPIWDLQDGEDPTITASSNVYVEGDTVEATPETVVTTTPLYGPGKHQEDLIESVVLRTAHYPGHWDASKDSLWVALPSVSPEANSGASNTSSGDQGWLMQLRESIAAANDLPPPASTPDRPPEEDKPKEKDAEVTDFFASLLKKT